MIQTLESHVIPRDHTNVVWNRAFTSSKAHTNKIILSQTQVKLHGDRIARSRKKNCTKKRFTSTMNLATIEDVPNFSCDEARQRRLPHSVSGQESKNRVQSVFSILMTEQMKNRQREPWRRVSEQSERRRQKSKICGLKKETYFRGQRSSVQRQCQFSQPLARKLCRTNWSKNSTKH